MIDEIFDRQYRSARGELNDSLTRGLSRFGTALKDVFEVLVSIEYQSPWARPPRQAR